jgi:uncharacterized protein (TIGR02118 family)
VTDGRESAARALFAADNKEHTVIKVGVFYPHTDSSKFDMSYYLEKHIPMVKKKMGSALKGVFVDQGLSGGAPGTAMAYTAIGHLLFDSVEGFQQAFAAHAQEIMADVSNYSNVQPIVQISEVKL